MMRGGREPDAKVTVPLFPRLHVNDAANEVGPRAPPRNKMALYEQLSIPSSAHRFRDHGATSAALVVPVTSPSPRHGCSRGGGGGGGGTVSSSGSKGPGCTRERDVFPPRYLEQAAGPSSDGIPDSPSTATKANALKTGFATPSPRSGIQSCPGISRSANGDDSYAVKNSCDRNLSNDDDFTVPTFFHSAAAARPSLKAPPSTGLCSAAESEKENANPTCSTSNQSMDVPQEQPPGSILTSMKREKIDARQKVEGADTVEPLMANNVNAGPVVDGNTGESSSILNGFSHRENDRSALAGPEKSIEGRMQQCNGNYHAELNVFGVTREAVATCPNAVKLPNPMGDNAPCILELDQDVSECAATDSASTILKDMDKIDEDSDTSVLDSEPGFDLSPDDVVRVVGAKHFWKARRAIANQQRVFAVQVFELHRLIKVQKLIAASPQLLLEGSPCFTSSRNVPSKKRTSLRSPKQITMEDDSQKENCNDRKTETMRAPQHHPKKRHKRKFGELLQNGPYSGGNSSLFHMGSERRPPGSWCFPPSGSQWLVPVMSPSEGLVYKPYVGSCPPTGAFMAPFFGGCGSFVAPPAVGDCGGTALGFPSPLPEPNVTFQGSPAGAPGYTPAPYGFPVANPLTSPSNKQVIFPRGNSDEHSHSLNSDNMSNDQCEAAFGSRVHGGQNNGLHMSTASTTSRAQEGADLSSSFVTLPLTSEGYGSTMPVHDGDAVPRVIKVVPHNRRTATESAARIFQSIQEERQQHHEPV